MILFTFIVGLLSCQVQAWSHPRIRVNGEDPTESDVVIDAGSLLVLTCEGDGPVTIVPRLARYKSYSKANGTMCTFTVPNTTPRLTGNYKCVYAGIDSPNFSSVYIFVRDSKTLFETPQNLRIIMKEREDALIPCLLTDPAATHVQFHMENGSAPPPDMNITFDPKKGMLIQSLQLWFSSKYVCSARIGGVEKVSPAITLQVTPRARFPPNVFLQIDEHIRLVGERLEIICSTSNPTFNYNVTWKHSSRLLPGPENKATWENESVKMKSKLILPAVAKSDSGNITCIGANEAGVNSATTHLLVVEEPYIRLSPKLSPPLVHDALSINVHEGQDVELKVTIEAYPQITLQQWDGPTFYNGSQHESSLFRNNKRDEAVLHLKRLNSKEQGRYTFYTNSSRVHASITFRIHVYEKPVIVDKRRNESSLICTASGYPAPTILWFQCQGTRPTCTENSTYVEAQQLTAEKVEMKRDEFGPVEVESFLTVTPSNQKMTVECVAQNLVGQDSSVFPIDQSEKLFTAILIGAISVMVFLLLLLLILMYKYKQKPKYEIRWKIIEATDGNNYTFIDPTQLPYNEKWEFPRDKLKLGKILGSGAFGKVVEATAYGLGKEDNVTRVAVKMLKASAHSDEKEALMSELKILSHLGQHKNIVNLLGACTHGGPVLVITEYCCHGDLLNLLRNKAETFLNCVVSIPEERRGDIYKNVIGNKMYFRSDSGISSTCSDSYLDMKPLVPRSQTARVPSVNQEGDSLDMDDLLRFSYQVAQGLEFLAAKNCIHRDVAARNVLLSDGGVAKICDFGLARDIMNDSNYVVKGNARLPVKWMAPESIFECVYTVQSDVWSYGILLWEIFSLGKSPYPNILVDYKFYKMIKSGYQMSRPDFAPPEMYTIMKMCWNLEPTERPTFSKIAQLIERMLGENPDQTLYQNMQKEELDEEQLEACDTTKSDEESCEQEEDEQPLMKANNYQFC